MGTVCYTFQFYVFVCECKIRPCLIMYLPKYNNINSMMYLFDNIEISFSVKKKKIYQFLYCLLNMVLHVLNYLNIGVIN